VLAKRQKGKNNFAFLPLPVPFSLCLLPFQKVDFKLDFLQT